MKNLIFIAVIVVTLLFIPSDVEAQSWYPGDYCYSMNMTFDPHILHSNDSAEIDFYLHCNHGCLPLQYDEGIPSVSTDDKGYNMYLAWPSYNQSYCEGLGAQSTHYYWNVDYMIGNREYIYFDIIVTTVEFFEKSKYIFD